MTNDGPHAPRTPAECKTIDQLRECIDSIDLRLVQLLAERRGFVDAAAQFKNSADGVRAEDRQRAMLVARRQWASDLGVDPELVDELFRNMVRRFIDQELTRFETRSDT